MKEIIIVVKALSKNVNKQELTKHDNYIFSYIGGNIFVYWLKVGWKIICVLERRHTGVVGLKFLYLFKMWGDL